MIDSIIEASGAESLVTRLWHATAEGDSSNDNRGNKKVRW
jgi:hypothetical protein